MKITDFKIAGLRGATPAGGWSKEIQYHECIHTLVLLQTDVGTWGLGSVFTNEALVHGAMEVLWPLLQGESALEPERVSEKLHQNTFWMGRGGTLTHAISGIDMALWDIQGKTLEQPVGRLLGGRYRESVMPYASLLMEEPEGLGHTLAALLDEGFRAFKMGWGPFGRGFRQYGRGNSEDGALYSRTRLFTHGGCGSQRRFLGPRLEMGSTRFEDVG